MREDLHLPAPPLDVPGVHAEQVRGKNRRLIATGARADLEDRIAIVQRVVRDEQRLEALFQRGNRRLETLDFLLRLGGHLGVINGNELPRLRELVLVLPEARGQLHEWSQPAMFASKLGQPPSILHRFWIRE